MNYAEHLIKYKADNLKQYFPKDENESDPIKWLEVYKTKLQSIDHDEPWLTLIAAHALFGDKPGSNPTSVDALNKLLANTGLKANFTTVSTVTVEKKLPEIIEYRDHLKQEISSDNFHLYPDRIKAIKIKKANENASFEGNTNLDLLIEGQSNEKDAVIFIEAKFLSDISYQTKYNPVRDQIIRNIDCGIDYCHKHNIDFKNFFFCLLTPGVFRPVEFGTRKETKLSQFGSTSSRLYCYKMIEYKNPNNLKAALPHRNLEDSVWEQIAQNIGWVTFEDIIQAALLNKCITDKKEEEMITTFFKDRNLHV